MILIILSLKIKRHIDQTKKSLCGIMTHIVHPDRERFFDLGLSTSKKFQRQDQIGGNNEHLQ